MVRFGARLLLALMVLAAIGGARGGEAARPTALRSPGDNVGWDGRFNELGARRYGGQMEDLVVAPDGAVYAIGDFDWISDEVDSAIAQHQRLVARWNGADWEVIGVADRYIHAIFADETGVYVSGGFSSIDGVAAPQIARWDGSAWSGFGSGPAPGDSRASLFSIARWDGAVYVAGVTSGDGGYSWNIYRWNGGAWQGMRSAPDSIRELKVIAAGPGGLYAGGAFSSLNGVEARHIARWNGTAWQPLGAGVSASINDIAVSGQDVYVGGGTDEPGGMLMRWDGAAWTPLGAGLSTVYRIVVSGADIYALTGHTLWLRRGGAWSLQATAAGTISALAVTGDALMVGGSFGAIEGVAALNLARRVGGSWQPWGGAGHAGAVRAFAGTSEHLYAGGIFDVVGDVPASNIAAWDGAGWAPLGSGVEGTVEALAVSGSTLYAGGALDEAGGVEVSGIAAWDGSAWSAVTQGVTATDGVQGRVTSLLAVGDSLYVGGRFDYAGGQPASNLARWDGQSWSAIGGGVNGMVNALAWDGANLYVAGSFGVAGGQPVRNLARWDGQSWSAVGAATGNDNILELAWHDGSLYAGGAFESLGGVASPGVARWDGQRWQPLGRGVVPAVDRTNALAYVAAFSVRDGMLYAGGYFEGVVNGDGAVVASRGVARWDGQRWQGLGTGAGPVAHALADRPDGLYVGGEIGGAGGKVSFGIARWTEPLRTYLPLAGR